MTDIEIRQDQTGEARTFGSKQAVADFLAGRDDAPHWEGYQNLGPLPDPTAEDPGISDQVAKEFVRLAFEGANKAQAPKATKPKSKGR